LARGVTLGSEPEELRPRLHVLRLTEGAEGENPGRSVPTPTEVVVSWNRGMDEGDIMDGEPRPQFLCSSLFIESRTQERRMNRCELRLSAIFCSGTLDEWMERRLVSALGRLSDGVAQVGQVTVSC
jgi:hypothetical protein